MGNMFYRIFMCGFIWMWMQDVAGRNAGQLLEDKDWTDVLFPHDWSISLDFDERLGGCNGHLPGGIGWYRKTFEVSKKDRNKRFFVLFDGIYNRSDVFLNGNHLGFRPYGFCYQQYDLTPYLIYGGKNVLSVRVNNPSDNGSIARWYTGSGIYRHAWLIKTADYPTDTVAVCEMRTAGDPMHLHAEADRAELAADGQDLSYVQVEKNAVAPVPSFR